MRCVLGEGRDVRDTQSDGKEWDAAESVSPAAAFFETDEMRPCRPAALNSHVELCSKRGYAADDDGE